MTTISNLVMEMSVNTTKLETGLANAVKSVRQQTSVMSSAIDSLKTGLATLGVSFGIREVAGWAESIIEGAAALKTLSQQVGLTTTEFQVFSLQAQAVGVSQEEMTVAIRKMTDNVGLAAQGNKTALDSFNRLGVGVLDSNNKIRSSGDIYRDITDALSRIKDPAARAALEVQIFGRAGQELDPAMRQGAAGIDAAKEAADRFNLIIGPAAIEKLDKFKQRIDLAKDSVHVLATEAAAASVDVIDLLSKMALDTQKLLFQGPQSLLPGAKSGVLPPNELGSPTGAGTIFTPPAATHNPAATGAGDAAAAEALKVQNIIDKINEETEALKGNNDSQKLNQALREAGTKATEEQRAQIEAAVDAWKTQSDQVERETELQKELSAEMDDRKRLMDEGKALTDSLATAQEIYNSKLADANRLLADHAITQETYDRDLKQMKIDLDNAGAATAKLSQTVGTDLGNSLADSALNFQDWGTSVSSVLRAVLNDLLRFLDAGNSSTGGSGGWLGWLLSSIFSGASGAFTGPGGSVFGGGRASGGSVSAGTAFLVGEQGPELFVPGQSGSILPNDAVASLSSGGGGKPSSVYVDARGADPSVINRLERAIATLNSTLENRALAAVGNARKRGGAFAQSFAG